MGKTFEISEELVDGLLNYLSERPHKEVRDGVTALENLKEIKEES